MIMDDRVFLATNARGIVRAGCGDNGTWRVQTVLAGQDVRCLTSDPFRPEVVYAGTAAQGLFRSTDRGGTWQYVGGDGLQMRALAPSPHRAGLLYAGARPVSVYVSEDGGRQWRALDGMQRARRWYWFSPAEPPSLTPYVQALSVSPTDPDVIIAGIEAGAVLRSEDGGRTWSGHRPGADRDCHTLTFHVADGAWVYEGGGGGPAVSRDGGRRWDHSRSGMDGRYCWACAADPERPEVWYVSASPMFKFPSLSFVPQAHKDGEAEAAIYRSSGGAAWEKLAGGLPQPLDYMAYGLVTDRARPGHLYAGLANGDVWHSTDYGDSWSQLPFNLGGIHRTMILLPGG
jgi:hypothetical protein